MAALFGELAYNQIHDISKRAGWKDADPRKATLHALVGGIMAKLGDKGLISNIPIGSSDAATSTTKSAVAPGTITIRDKGKQNRILVL